MKILQGLTDAGSFLTVLPFGKKGRGDFSDSMRRAVPHFGAVGLIIGCMLAGLSRVLALLPPSPAAWFLVLASLGISGGLHLDGLADTADGILVAAGRKKRLKIMSDSRVGTFGAAAVVLAVLGLQTGYSGLLGARDAFAWLILAPGVSRWSMVLVMCLFRPPERQRKGMAEAVGEISPLGALGATIAPAAAAAALVGWRVAFPWTAAACVALCCAAAMRSRLGGLTGDTFGAVQVLSELAFVFWAAFFPLMVSGS